MRVWLVLQYILVWYDVYSGAIVLIVKSVQHFGEVLDVIHALCCYCPVMSLKWYPKLLFCVFLGKN